MASTKIGATSPSADRAKQLTMGQKPEKDAVEDTPVEDTPVDGDAPEA